MFTVNCDLSQLTSPCLEVIHKASLGLPGLLCSCTNPSINLFSHEIWCFSVHKSIMSTSCSLLIPEAVFQNWLLAETTHCFLGFSCHLQHASWALMHNANLIQSNPCQLKVPQSQRTRLFMQNLLLVFRKWYSNDKWSKTSLLSVYDLKIYNTINHSFCNLFIEM